MPTLLYDLGKTLPFSGPQFLHLLDDPSGSCCLHPTPTLSTLSHLHLPLVGQQAVTKSMACS